MDDLRVLRSISQAKCCSGKRTPSLIGRWKPWPAWHRSLAQMVPLRELRDSCARGQEGEVASLHAAAKSRLASLCRSWAVSLGSGSASETP